MIENLPDIIAQMTEPAKSIDSIKIVDIGNGAKGLIGGDKEGIIASKGSLPEQITDAMMNYSVGSAMINDMLKESGLSKTAGVKELKDFLKTNDIGKSNPTSE